MYDEIKLKTAANEKLPTVKLLPTIFLNSEIKSDDRNACARCLSTAYFYELQYLHRILAWNRFVVPLKCQIMLLCIIAFRSARELTRCQIYRYSDWLLSLTSQSQYSQRCDHKSYTSKQFNTFMHYWVHQCEWYISYIRPRLHIHQTV